MRLRDQYDWIVLGDHPGALLSAGLAARLGLSVLVLPISPEQNLHISDTDDYLDLESNFVLGLGRSEVVPGLTAACLDQLGVVPQEKSLIQSDRSWTQILTREGRVSLKADPQRFVAELEREFGAESVRKSGLTEALKHSESDLGKFWIQLPKRLTLKPAGGEEVASAPVGRRLSIRKDPMTLRKLASNLSRGLGSGEHHVREWLSLDKTFSARAAKDASVGAMADFVEGLGSSLTASRVPADMPLFHFLHLLALSRSGASFKGGMSAYRDLLLRLARRNGADLPPKTECRRIFVQGGKFAGVLPSSSGSMIAGTGGILGIPIHKAKPFIATSGNRWFRDLKKPLKPVGWKFTLALTVHVEALSPGMSSRMLWQEAGAPFLEIEVTQPMDYGFKDQKRTVIFIRSLMPMTEESLTPKYQRMIAARMLRKITEISPFLEFHITRIYPEFRNEGSPELRELYGYSTLAALPASLLCYAGGGLGSQTGVDGLFLSSAESFPELGSLGGTVSAIESVAWLAHRSGLSGPFK